jgi:uncharacterized protein
MSEKSLRIGLVSDTHGVADPDLHRIFQGVDHICHAGDVGHHGSGEKAVLDLLAAIGPVTAVRGNVDATSEILPSHALLDLNGYKLLLIHIVNGSPCGSIDNMAAALIQDTQCDIVVFGHSHKFEVTWKEGRLFVNPGSAGPARFKLQRTAAILTVPPKSDANSMPTVVCRTLNPKAPPRAQNRTHRKRKFDLLQTK